MHLLYPASPFKARLPDEQYAEEVQSVAEAGFDVSLFSFEDFQAGEMRPAPQLPDRSSVLYRGWMLTGAEYSRLIAGMARFDAHTLIDLESYLACHHLPNWYPMIADLTPETRILPADCDLEKELRSIGWTEFFVKDYVKSLKTKAGSRISNPEQAAELVANMRQFRGTIEGGFCVRRVEPFKPNTERRFFAANGSVFGGPTEVPDIVRDCASRIRSKFFSVDVIEREDGKLRIVEIGDAQVSDLVGWTPQQFVEVLKELAKAS